MTSVVTKDGVVHVAVPDGPEGPMTKCGLTEQTFVTEGHRRPTCWECANTEVCPKCNQSVETEVLTGRARVVTMTKVHVVAGKVCHAILTTKETR